jgi:UDP:flavonoid glycosyltransferase YjiC (YdhE family)
MEERKVRRTPLRRGPMADDGAKLSNLNLKITEDERWAFKELCVRHRMSQVDGFRLAARLLEDHLETNKKKSEGE